MEQPTVRSAPRLAHRRPAALLMVLLSAWLAAPCLSKADSAFSSGVIDKQALSWTTGGDASWTSDSSTKRDLWSGRSGSIGHSRETWVQTTIQAPARVSFFWKVSSEASYDFLRFRVNGTDVALISGEVDWTEVVYNVTGTGNATLQFSYSKDYAVANGSDAGWVDSMTILSGETSTVLTGLPGLPFSPGSSSFWTKDTSVSREGGSSMRSGAIPDNGSTSLLLQDVPGSQTVSYYGKVSSEGSYDFLRFYVDDVEVSGSAMSGEAGWTQVSKLLGSGTHVLKWVYSKDSGVVRGSDAAWIDSVVVGYPPVILAQPTGGSYTAGQTLRLTCDAGGGSGTTFQWKKDGVNLSNGGRISGANTTTLVISSLVVSDAGSYTLTASSTFGSVTSSSAAVSLPLPPSITAQPLGQTVNTGQTISLSVTASGPGTLSYQWRKDNVAINGATSSTLNIANAAAGNAGTYTVVVSNPSGSVTSSGAIVVVRTPPVISTQPLTQAALIGSRVVLSVQASSLYTPLTYQWKKGGIDLANSTSISGATTAELVINPLSSGDAGSYTVVVSNPAGGVTSSSATLTAVALNHAPTLAAIANLTRLEDAASQSVPLTGIADGDSGTQTLTVIATSSDPTLVPNPTVTYTSPGATGSLSLTSTAGRSGTATITVKVRDNGGTTLGGVDAVTNRFVVTVTPVNDTPTLNPLGNLTLLDSLGQASGGYTNDFTTDASGGTLYLSAARTLVDGNGKIQLTPNAFNVYGGYFLADLSPNRAASSFTARFRAFAGQGSSSPADGFSFNFLGENPATASYGFAEDGIGTGLTVGFHIYTSNGTQPGYVVLKYGGIEIARTNYMVLNVGTPQQMPLVEVSMTSDRKVTVKHNGYTLFNAVQTQCSPAAGWRFGFAGRTGGQSALQLIDDVVINTSGQNPAQVVPLSGIADGDGGGQALTVTATSSNPSLVGHPSVVYTSPNSTGSLIVPAPAVNSSGTVTITVRVQDNGGTANGAIDFIDRQFVVTVVAVNDAPTLNPIPNLAVIDTAGTQTVNLSGITDGGDGGTQTISITASSGTPSIIPNPAITYTSPSATGTLQFTPVVGTSGSVIITVTAQDNGGTLNGGANTVTRTFTVKVGPVPPVIEQAPENQITLAGQNVTFSAVAQGYGLTYKWFKNGTEIAGATSSSLTLSNVTSAAAATYRIQVFNSNTSLIYPFSDATLAVVQPPTRTAVLPTQQASFTNVVTSPGTATVQWLKDGNEISGATGGTYTIGTTQTSDAADYSVRVTAGGKTLLTPPVTLRLIGGLPSLFNTGINTNGLRLPDRLPDPHYSLISPSPVLGQAVSVVTSGTYPIPPWIEGGTNSAWISPTARLREAGSASGTQYTYRTTFDLTGMDPTTIKIAGQLAADDTLSAIQLNGITIATPSGVTSNAYQAFSLNLPLTTGQDSFASRANLGSANSITAKASNVGATGELGEPTPLGATYHGTINSVWWKWTAPANGSVTVDSAGITSIASILSVFTGSSLSQLTTVGSDGQNGFWTQSIRTVTFSATAGTEYQISMDGFYDYVGDLQMNLRFTADVTQPAIQNGNDSFAARSDLGTRLTATSTGTLVGATGELGEPQPNIGLTGAMNSIWWKWTSPGNGTVVIDTIGSLASPGVQLDTMLEVFTGSSLPSLSLVAWADEGTQVYGASLVAINVSAGTEYQIRVDGYANLVGSVVLNLNASGLTIPPPTPSPLVELASLLPGTNTLDFIVKNTADSGLDRSLTGLRVEYTGAQGVPNPVQITTQPVGGIVSFGTRKTLSVGVVSGSPVTYQWFKDNQLIEGATDATLVYNKIDDSDAGSYTVRVTNLNGVRTSEPAVLLVDIPLTITSHPADVAAAVGSSVQFSVRFRGNAPLSVQWQRNGSDIPGETSSTLTLPSLTVAAAGRYGAVVRDRDATLTSNDASLTVVEPPVLVQEPRDFSGVEGRDRLQMQAIVDGSVPMSYRWFLNNIPLATGNSATLNLGVLRESQAGSYKLIASNLAGAVTSRLAQVHVVLPPFITNATPNLKVYTGESAEFSVHAGGSGNLEYQWYRGGTVLPDQTSSSLSLTNLIPGNGGEFSVTVSSPYGTATNSFKLEVYSPPVPVVSTGLEIAQEFTLLPGWNAIFLNVQPTNNTVRDVFGSLPFTSIWRWADPKSGPQFIAEQSEALLDTAKWQIHLPTNRVESFQNNLFRVFRHNAYLIKLETNAPVTFTVVGRPGYQRQRWASDAYTLLGFPVVPGTNAPTVGDYFKPSAAHYDSTTGNARAIYDLQADGTWVPLSATNQLVAGRAYWTYTRGASDYLAPIEASFQGLTALTYGVGAETKEFTVHYVATTDPAGSPSVASLSHIMGDQSLPLQINEFSPAQGTQWRDLPNAYSVGYQGQTTRTIRLTAKRERIPGLNYQGIMTLDSPLGVQHLIPVIVDRDEDKVAAQPEQPFNPVGLWLGSVSISHVSEVNGLTTNYVVTLVTNIVDGATNVVEQPSTEVKNVVVGSLPTPVKDPFEMRLILHADTNGVSQLLQQVTLLTTEAKTTTTGGNVTQITGGDPVLVSNPALLTKFKGVALRGRETVGRRFSTPFYPMYNTNGVPFDGALGLGSTITAAWSLPASAPLNPFYHKYHPDHDNLDASFKVYKEEAYTVRRTVSLVIPARQASNSKPGMGQDEIQGTYIETVQGLHRTQITAQGTFHLKRILAVGAINPTGN